MGVSVSRGDAPESEMGAPLKLMDEVMREVGTYVAHVDAFMRRDAGAGAGAGAGAHPL
jgi:hypothetical protein